MGLHRKVSPGFQHLPKRGDGLSSPIGVKLSVVELKVKYSRGSSRGCPGATKEAPVRRILRTGCSFVAPGQPRELPLLRPTVANLTPMGYPQEAPYLDQFGEALLMFS